MPGRGEVTNPPGSWNACGTVRHLEACGGDRTHDWELQYNSCDGRDCPVCSPNWMDRAARNGARRISGYFFENRNTFHSSSYPPRHWDDSVPKSVYERLLAKYPEPLEFYRRLRAAGRRHFAKTGLKGALVILHLFRLKDSDDKNEESWKWVLQQTNWIDYVVFAPHFHLIAFGYEGRAPQIYEETGWVLSLLSLKEKGNLLDEEKDVVRLIRYLLTHASVLGDTSTITYWGCLSSRYLSCTKYWKDEQKVCKVCGEVHTIYEDRAVSLAACQKGEPNWVNTGVPVIVKKEYRVYRITPAGNPFNIKLTRALWWLWGGDPPPLDVKGGPRPKELPYWVPYVLDVPIERI